MIKNLESRFFVKIKLSDSLLEVIAVLIFKPAVFVRREFFGYRPVGFAPRLFVARTRTLGIVPSLCVRDDKMSRTLLGYDTAG